jgi:hypothetical protein
MAGAACVSILLSGIALVVFGQNTQGLDVALMLTGRWAFLLFWPAYAGAGTVALLGGRFAYLRRHGRAFGLAFAAAMLPHVGLIAWLCAIGAPPARRVFLVFGVGLVCTYTLAAFSLSGLQRRLGRRSWWLLRTGAMTYIALIFAADFLRDPLSGGLARVAFYVPFALLSLLGFAAYGVGLILPAHKSFSTAQ